MLSRFERKFGKERPWGGKRKILLTPRRAAIYIGLILGAMAVLGLMLIILGAVKITAVNVSGCLLYNDEHIIDSADLHKGDGYWDFDPAALEDEIMDELVYIKDVKVRRHINGSVSISVTEESNFYYTRHNVNYYLFSGDTWRVICADNVSDTFRALGATYLELPDDARIRVGEKLSFEYSLHVDGTAEVPDEELTTPSGDANEDYKYVFEVIKKANASKFAGKISHIGLSDRYGLYIAVGKNVMISLGTIDELERKLDAAYAVYEYHYDSIISTGFNGAIIEAADPAKTTFRESLNLNLPK